MYDIDRKSCTACRKVGALHCSDPTNCGQMKDEADNWMSWLDDLPVQAEFDEGIGRLQEYISALRAALDKAEETIGESALQYLSDTGQLMEQIARLKEREEYLVDLLDRITDYQAVIDCLSIPELNEVTDAMAEYTKGVKDDLGT